MKINFKLNHPNAEIPSYSQEGDIGLDLTAVSITVTDKYIEYDTGICVEIPEGYGGFVFPRSSNSKKDLILSNSVGVIDQNYRGSIKFRFKINHNENFDFTLLNMENELVEIIDPTGVINSTELYNIGDRIGQLVILPCPKIEPNKVHELSDTERGDKGFGSSGN